MLYQWIYKQRFRKHNQVKINKRKDRRFGGKWCHDVTETSFFPIAYFYLVMDNVLLINPNASVVKTLGGDEGTVPTK